MSMEEYRKQMREKYGSASSNNASSATPSNTEVDDYYANHAKKVRSQYASDISTVSVDSFLRKANSYFNTASSNLKTTGYSSASSAAENRRKQAQELRLEALSVDRYLDQHRDQFDDDTYNRLKRYIRDIGYETAEVTDAFDNVEDFYSQFTDREKVNDYRERLRQAGLIEKYSGKTYKELSAISAGLGESDEKNWLDAYATEKDREEKLAFDAARGAEEIENLERILDEYKALSRTMIDDRMQERLDYITEHYGDERGIKALISEKRQYLDQAKRLQEGAAWASVVNNDDFKEHSRYSSTASNGLWEKMWSQYGMGYDDLAYEYINNQNGIRDEISSKSRAYRSDTKDSKSTFEENHYDYMKPEEVSIYNYYYSKHGKKKAEEYLASIAGTLEQRANNETVKNVSEFASEHPWISSALSVGTSVLSGQEYVGDLIEYGKDKVLGKPARLGTNEAALMTNTVRGTVSDQVDWEIGNWDAFDFLYSTAMSGADSLTAGIVFGNLGGAVLGLSAAAQGTNDALARGMSDGQAFWNGLFSGVFEGLFESISIGNFNKLKEVAPESVKDIIKNLGKSMLVNASEETLTEIANIAYDTLINGEFANYTWEELKSGAWKDALWQVMEAGASGALMGVGMSGAGNAIGYFNGNKDAKQIYGGSQQELVGEALEINPDNTFAQDMQTKLDLGKNLSGRQLNRLVKQNEAALTAQDMATIQAAAENRLTELGETGDVGTIAAALAKQAAGQKLTRAEQQAITSSKYGQRIANELNPENIRSGEYASAWAEGLDTQRINPEEYSRMLEAAQLPQETAETTGSQVVTAAPKMTQAPQAAPVEAPAATVLENRTVSKEETVPANDQQVTSKLTAEESSVAEEKTVTLEDASKKYGAQAQAMIHTYTAGQDVAKYDKAYQAAYDMGKSGVSLSYVMGSQSVSYLTDTQKELAYEAGSAASNTAAKELDTKNKATANGKTGRKKGTVKGEGVTISDLKQTFNDTQGRAYKYLSTVAEATGIDIVLYRSEAGEDGKFQGAQGRYSRKEPGTIYIDLNAGLSDIKSADDLAKYAMLRTFAHEFTHFIENWNPIQYNEFRKVVFDTLTERGENVHDLIEDKQARTPGMSYDNASREIVAEAMTDILPDVNFVQELAENHKTIFQKLLDQLKEFVENLRAYFNSIGHNRSKEANALKEQVGATVKYLDSIVKLFDQVAVQAVENYQQTVAEDVVVSEIENTTTVSAVTTEATTKEATPVVEKDAYGFTISDNVERGSLEISFDSKPSDEVRHVLKENKFRWHKVKKVWFGYTDRQTITDALHAAYEAETKPADTATKPVESVIAPAESVITPAETEPAYDPNDPYVRLANLMGHRARFEHEGFIYRVLKAGPDNSMWQGRIDAADVSVGGMYVTNARGIHYTSELYENREDARDDIIATAKASKLLDEKPTETTKPNEEVTDNGENVDNQATAQQPVTDGRGAAQVLDELPAEDVSGDGGSGNPVADAGERGQQTARDGDRDDSQRPVGGSGEGSSQSGDLRGTDRVTEAVTDTNVGSKLHEEVVEQIAQQSTEKPKGRNFVIGDSLDLPNGEKARYKANVEAIRLVKQLEAEGRYATEAEQVILSKYVGWGGLANAFSDKKADWAKEYAELKELLTDEEYSSARGSTLNAHYTDISVIKAMYDGLKQLGFTGGRMMEPSSGVGNFVGAMPADMSAKVRSWTMVELDGITGLIAKYLYPNADVRIQGFEKAKIPNDFMDVAISNVPFGNYAIADKTYPKKVTGAIHNYFFAKSLDKVRPGGIVMFITSSYTMNAKDSTVRRYIMQKADLLGAIRLPDNAFKGNAGTEVVTDILILKKRAANTTYAGEDFLEAPYKYISGYNGAYINTYFENHPEMVLGTPTMSGSMYRGDSLTYKAFEGKGSLADQIREAFKNIQGKMDYPAQQSPEKTNFAVERAGKNTKENGLVVKDGKVYKNTGGELIEQTVAKGVADRIAGMLEIRDAAKELQTAQQQGLKDSEIKKARQKLNKAYDAFVKKHGFINSQANRNAIKADPDNYSILALENWNPETKKATKSDIFSKNTIEPNRTVNSAKDVAEGLIVSINQTGGVDAALIAKLTGKTEAEVTRELLDSRAVFKNRDGGLETAEIYLSGNVRAKLRDAEALVSLDADYQKNVEALKAIVPEDVGYQDIFVNPGTPWIPDTVYSDFAAHMLGTVNHEWNPAIMVTRNKDTGNFVVELKNKYLKTNSYNTQKWGTNRRSFLDLFDAMLNSKSVVVKYKTDDGKSVVDQDATAAANEKIEAIQKEFQEWLWKDETRRTDLAVLYNETFNSIVTPKYNGDNLTVNGANAMKPLRPHQRNAVQRIIASGGNTLLAHKVGAGKTYEMAAAAMKLKQLGLVKKPLFAVPKSLVAQWGNEFMDFFPTAKLLVAEAGDFTASNRKIFANRIANGDYDAVIVSYEQFEKLPISAEFARELYQEQIESIILAIEEAKAEKGGKSLSVKDLEKKRKSLQTKIDKLTDSAKDEDNIEFEQLGVDSIFVDEAHNFKNLFYTTSMTNVSGLGNKDGSKRAFDLYTKVRYLQKLNGGRGIVFATATPVMNSMSEMYIMQKYLQPDLLDQLGLSTFDAWAKQFGEVVNGVEIKPSGQGYRVKQSFSRFKNMSELQLLFRNFADVLTDIPGLKIPKMKGGKVNVVVCEPGQFQQDYMKELEKRADNIKNVDPSVDNMLKITSDGRKISYTQRMIDPSLPYEEGCKIYRCADNVVSVYQDSKAVKGTQLIFCDMATPKGKSKTAATEAEDIETDMESAKLYDDIKARLIKGGIPAKEIAFIHEADTDAKKKKLFADVNDGKVRVLIGSTGKMGVGMNAQKRIAAIHHLDAPWRPGDVEQRNGRAYRQGNINEEVENFTYVTEGSFDARLWDILDRKQSFINQVMNGENVGRETEDTGEVTLSAAEVKALASGSPLIMEQVQLDTEIKKLESLRRAHRSAVTNAISRLEKDKGRIPVLEKMIANGKADTSARVDTYSDGKFSITIGNQKFTEKKDAGVALMAEATAKATETDYTTIAKFAGFDLRVIKTVEGIKGLISGKQGYSFNTYPGNTTYMINHLIARVEEISEAVSKWEQELSQTRKDMAEQEQLMKQPFTKQAELDKKRARYNEIMEILNPKEEQALDTMAEDVQEQSRSYLSNEAEEFRSDIDAWDRSGRPAGETFILGSTGDVLQGLGAVESDVYVQGDKIDTIFQDHPEMTTKEIKNLPEILENPVMVLASRNLNRGMQSNTRLTIFGMVKAQNGLPVMVAFDLHPVENKLYLSDMQKVVSAYTKDNSPTATMKLMQNSDVLYADKEKTASLLHTAGFHNAYRIEQSGYIGNIAYEDDAVKITGKQFNEVFSESYQNQQRTDTLTDREVLAMAASQIQVDDLSAAEKDALDVFQKRLSKLEALQTERAEQGRLYKEQQFGAKVDRAKAAETLNRMHTLDSQIQKASADVLTVEEKVVLKRVLQKARTVVEQQERQHGQEILKRWRDRRNNAEAIKKYRDRIRDDVDELTNWVLHPDNKNVVKHIPDALKNTVIPFLSSINFMSKRSLRGGEATAADNEFMRRLNGLKSALKPNQNPEKLYADYSDLPPDFLDRLQAFIDAAQVLLNRNSGELIINQMTSEELRELSRVVRTLKVYIKQMNRFHVNAMFKHVYEAGDNSIDFLSQLKPADDTGGISQFLLWQQMRPAYAFERFGEGGMAIYDGLRRGQATLAFNTKKIQAFAEKAYTTAEVKAWENQVKTIHIGPDKTVKMRVSQIMSLYELNKREQARGHILGEGIRVATFTNGRKKISDVGQKLTIEDVNTIIGQLTPRQIEVADKLQQFMQRQGGEWGNYVTIARFGEKQFGEENYFPINSDGRHLSVDADEKPGAAALYALLNMGFTKQTQEKAKNRIIVYSIFDVFANHMASMAQYNAFALPVVDALKWFNYQQVAINEDGSKTILGSVREQMDRAFGVPEEIRPGSGRRGYAQSFMINIIKAFNGTEAQGTPYDSFGMQALHHYNRAQVAYNFRVVVQQPLAVTRAAMVIDYASIIKGMKLNPAAIQRNIAEMQKYSGIAAWKALGFYDVNISRGLTSLIKHDDTAADKITEVGMWGAEKADTLTWAGIWSACKEEVIRKQRLTPKSEGFYEAVTKLFENVIYKTQVVDSVLTKNEFMRDKGFFARAVGSFMSEPTTTASMLVDAYDKYHMDMQRGLTRQQAWKKNRRMIVRTAYVYGLGAVILAAVQAVADALRDDDDYMEFMEKWLEAFGGNLVDEVMPFNKLPIVSDFYELAKELLSKLGVDTYGNPPQSVFMQWYDSLVKGVEILYDRISSEDTNYTWYGGIYKLLQAVSGMAGLPMASATREIVTAWNNSVGAMAPSLKVKSYEPSRKAQIKYAYQDGYLTDEEATEQLLQHGLVDTENEAYWTIQGWEAGDGYSRYDAILDAVRNGGDFNAAMGELTSHGYTEKDVLSQVKSKISEWYAGGEITKQQATEMLSKYFDMEREEVTSTVNEWSCEVVTGIAYGDIKDEYLSGNITAQRAIEMYVRYGGYTQEKATEKVTKWRAEKETGVSYDDVKVAFKEGKITAADARNMLVTYGGYSEEDAKWKVKVYEWQNEGYDTESIYVIKDYEEFCEPAGIDKGTYFNAYQFYSDAGEEGVAYSKTIECMPYINSLPLTASQKTTLAQCWWAASTVNKYKLW